MGGINLRRGDERGWVVYIRHPLIMAKKIPFTLTFVVVVMITGIIMQTIGRDAFPTIMEKFGWDLNALRAGHYYDLWVELLFSSEVGHFYSLLGIGVVGIGALEFVSSTGLTALAFLVIGPLSSLITTLSLWGLMNLGVPGLREYLVTSDMGASVSCFVCWGLFITLLKGRWRWILLAGTALALILFQIWYKAIWNIDHSMAFVIGLLSGTGLLLVKKG
jgi:hypothetical protein